MKIYSKKVALCVDLDGTLIRSDMLFETCLTLIKTNPLILLLLPFWLMTGKSSFKRKIATRSDFDPSKLPYNLELIEWLTNKKKSGRFLVLCTASDMRIAKKINSYLKLFDEVIATDGKINISGANKSYLLTKRFGKFGFDYVGNSSVDIHVWKAARKGVIVSKSEKLIQAAKNCVDIEFIFGDTKKKEFHSWINAFRVHQWMKNILLFIPMLAAHQASSITSLLFAFSSFSICASSVYLINDLLDLENDRSHPRKFKRPFASGDLQIWQGLLIIPMLLIFSYLLSLQAGENFSKWLGVYFTITCFYSLKLKQIVLIDCIVLAILYTLRIVAGSASIGQSISFWLLAFSIFLFLSLAFLKRFAELQVQLIEGNHKTMGRGYFTDDAPLIQTFGVASGFLASLVLAFYLNTQNVIELYASPVWIWCCIPVLVFWMNWIWLKAFRGEMHDDPLVFAVKDKTSVLSGIFFSLFLILGTFL